VGEHARDGTAVVDGLRGLAILLVFGYHTWLFSWYTPPPPFDVFARTGYFGVELFFLISGFCLFYPYARHRLEAKRDQTLGAFVYRRFIKIVPSYLVALAVTFAIAFPTIQRSVALTSLGQHVFFVENFFNDPVGSSNSVLWSLGIEVQFYLIFPLLVASFAKRPLVAALVLAAGALGYRYYFGACCLTNELVMRQLPAFLDLFAFGMLAAYAFVWLRRRWSNIDGVAAARVSVFCTAAAIAFALISFELLAAANGVQYTDEGRERFNLFGRTALASTGFALVVASCFAERWWRRLLANPLLVFLSVISYNLYLWHTLVELWLVHHHLPPSSIKISHDDQVWRAWFIGISLVACIAISTAITYFLERPLLQTVRPHPFAFEWKRLGRKLTREPRAEAEF
jgi:peptidoglycan/LPS O-acetylase OafA/YrhL